MATYLDICQDVARDSGTFGTLPSPTSVEGQTGRALRLVHWVRDAYEQIQRDESDEWRWLHAEFEGQTIVNTREYTASGMGISERFKRWAFFNERNEQLMSVATTSEGHADEGYLTYFAWPEFRRQFLVGKYRDATGKPQAVTVDYQDRLVFYPLPDTTYTIRGAYYKTPQILTANEDTPEMPSDYHQAIRWKALIELGTYDEAPNQLPLWERNYNKVLHRLRTNQTPELRHGAPFA